MYDNKKKVFISYFSDGELKIGVIPHDQDILYTVIWFFLFLS